MEFSSKDYIAADIGPAIEVRNISSNYSYHIKNQYYCDKNDTLQWRQRLFVSRIKS